MRIVSKAPSGSPCGTIATLTECEAAAIKLFWKGVADKAQMRLAESVMATARRQNAWLACDCLGDNLAEPPILVPRRYEDGHHSLSRTGERVEHAHECIFHWEQGELGRRAVIEMDRPGFIIARYDSPHGSLLAGRGWGVGEDVTDGLLLNMRMLIKRAGLNRISADMSVSERLEMLRNNTETVFIDLAREYRLPLSTIFWTSMRALKDGWIASRMRLLRHREWPGNVPLQAYIMLYADEVWRYGFKHGKTKFDLQISSMETWGEIGDGPHLVLIHCRADQDESGQLQVKMIRGVAVPTLPNRVLAISDVRQRDTAKALLWVADRWAEEGGKALDIECLSSQETHDFVLAHEHDALRIRVLSHGDEMPNVVTSGVFVDDRRLDRIDGANQRLIRYVMGWLRRNQGGSGDQAVHEEAA